MRALPVVLLLLAAGCTRPAPVAAPAAPPAPAPAPAPAAVTCGDAGVLLRGTVDDQRQAGPAKEAAIARTCKYEQWSAELLQCVGGEVDAKACLDKLTPEQRTAYDQELTWWNERFPDETLETSLEEFAESAMDTYVDCGDALPSAAGFAPAVTLTGADRDYLLELRKDALVALCEDWDTSKRSCFRDVVIMGAVGNTSAIDACRAQLDPPEAKAVVDKLAELDKIGAKVAAVKRNAASYDCRQVVAAHYADAQWKGKLDAVKGAERAKVIAESRARMTKACTDDKWAPNLRACIVAGGADACFATAAVSASPWGFPAVGVFVKIGIPECDAYAQTMKAVDACGAIPQAQRDALKRSWSYLSATWASVTPDRRAATAQSCKQVDDAIRRTVTSAGCQI
ncbi:MAG TPA: hypothetical protein VNO30_24670 [Kofleriaceae bacterium]|nr:hypothetical protein [Kofleriaceae bacterium]